jgi:predicted nucleotidyltransferase/DNA-binding HxlR family transcriptional regulator
MTTLVDEKALAILGRLKGTQGVRFSELQLLVSNPRTLSSKLKMLESNGLVARERGSYTATDAGRKAAALLAEYQRLLGKEQGSQEVGRVPHPYYSPLLRDYCELLSESYGERLLGVVLFGSVARGDWKRESDVDLLVVVDGWESESDGSRVRELTALKARLARCGSHAEAMRNGFVPAVHEMPLAPPQLKVFRTVYLDIALDGIVLLDRRGEMRKFIESTRARAEEAGSRRVVYPDGTFYWILSRNRPGEVFELGIQR